MSPRLLWISLLAVALSFAGGFLLANALNKSEIEKLKGENNRLSKPAGPQTDSALSVEEIQNSIRQADADPANVQLQRNLGTALYRYSSIKKDIDLLNEAVRILERAAKLRPDDRELTVTLGNAHFDIGYFSKNNSELEAARGIYDQALRSKPDDADVRADLGLTFFLYDPPDLERASAEFKKSLASDPKHEKSLQFLIQSLARQRKADEARQYLAKLKESSPQNESIPELTALIENPAAVQTQ